MDRLEAMRLFVSAVETGSLAAAGRRHGHSPAAVTRAIAALERAAGETLLLRSTRRLALTPAGERHLTVYAAVGEALGEIAPEAESRSIRGIVSLTAPELFGRLVVMPLLEDFVALHPEVRARAVLQNRLVNLVAEGIDVAVRLAPLRDSNLKAVGVGRVRTLLCASEAYVHRCGEPRRPADLEGHSCIGLNAAGDGELWPFSNRSPVGRRRQSIRVEPRLAVDNAAAAIGAAERGLGVVRVRSYQVANAISEGRLLRLMRDHESDPTPVSLVFPRERAGRGASRALVDHVAPLLRQHLVDVEQRVGGP